MLSVTSLAAHATCSRFRSACGRPPAAARIRERTVSTLLYMLYSLPAFVAALFLQLLFYSKLGWLPLFGMTSDNFDSLIRRRQSLGHPQARAPADRLLHLRQPGVLLAASSSANMQEVIRQDYIRTARAKGVPPGRVLWHHAFRNTLIPLVTLIGLTLPQLAERRGHPGADLQLARHGPAVFRSRSASATTTRIMGLTLMFSVLTLLGQLLADILYAVVDPRVTYQ